ncbi:heat shock 70 kDa protein-like [Hyalella azteca]|uniref:Heat shock 70 kDa protein-like n=1 Tax=Hyalella azteca TaxID=294128 RepID=A0A979FL54_HYAAZ|nr:heat shock 70 kDa protein-like [Hyalella azteca]
MAKPTIGIDFGTAKCCVATVMNGKAEVLPNARGDKTTPSWVAFNDVQYLVGEEAKDQALFSSMSSIYGVKKILGRAYEDQSVTSYSERYAIITYEGNRPMIILLRNGDFMALRPELVAAMLLLRMKQEAEAALGEIGGAVVSVPACTTRSQREAIVTACKIADLELLDLICEPKAAALAYRHNIRSVENTGSAQNSSFSECLNLRQAHNVLVFDMGAGKLDASLLSVDYTEVRVLAASGDEDLGGDYLDWVLMKEIEKRTSLRSKDDNPKFSKSLLSKKHACEKIKINLTFMKDSPVDCYNQGRFNAKFKSRMTRRQFEETFIRTLDKKVQVILSKLVKTAKIAKTEVKEIIVVGGSSRIPRVQQIVMDFFGIKKLNMTVNAEEAIAEGAALWAHELVDSGKLKSISASATLITREDMMLKSGKSYGEKNLKISAERRYSSLSGRHKGDYSHRGSGAPELPTRILPPLPEEEIVSAIEMLRQSETERKNYLKMIEVVNDIENFCLILRSKLKFLLASTDEALENVNAKDSITETDAKKIRNKLFKECRHLLTCDGSLCELKINMPISSEANGCQTHGRIDRKIHPLVNKDCRSEARFTPSSSSSVPTASKCNNVSTKSSCNNGPITSSCSSVPTTSSCSSVPITSGFIDAQDHWPKFRVRHKNLKNFYCK